MTVKIMLAVVGPQFIDWKIFNLFLNVLMGSGKMVQPGDVFKPMPGKTVASFTVL